MEPNDQSDFQLIRDYQDGDDLAFTTLFRKYYPLVLKAILSKGISPENAKDCTADIFIKLIDSLKKYRFEKSFTHFLRRVIRNKLYDYYRQNELNAQPMEFLEFKIKVPFDDSFIVEEIIQTCLRKIKSVQRRAIISLWIEGYKRSQIAEILSLPIGTVHSNLERGKSAFQKCVQDNLS